MQTPGKLLLSKLFRNCADPVAARVWIDLVGRMTMRTPEQLAAAFREAGFTDVTVAEARGPGATRHGPTFRTNNTSTTKGIQQ